MVHTVWTLPHGRYDMVLYFAHRFNRVTIWFEDFDRLRRNLCI